MALALAGLASGQTKPKDVYGWRKVTWGMTVADAKAAFGDQASDPAETPLPAGVLFVQFIVKDVKFGDINTKAAIETKVGSNLVSAVEIFAADWMEHPTDRATDGAKFTTLKALLIEKYGAPKNQGSTTDDIELGRTVDWIFPSTSISLRWSEASAAKYTGNVTISYHAVDKKAR